MSRKFVFWGYSLVALLILYLLPGYYTEITASEFASVLFGYKQEPFILMMSAGFMFFFDYVSLIIPQTELFSIRPMFLVRRPSVLRLYLAYFRFILPYFVPFVLVKLVALTVLNTPQVWFWIGLYALEWLLWIGVNQERRVAIPNFVILGVFVLTRIAAHFLMS